ncbi:hypothetical protein SAMN04490243_1607 [Robiginitalea myxolifaciens]|uniref:LTXXQ motif family protein n=1 Tax=Robiginitalea myxolifaciens TaxID=400055 RepID=A0A1I6GD47_9FLAO|nr:hypothetical protein [Robiginitalea myxolifaciens]SFR40109.1 hypothetical protein SAMN04490243_1607 [Robiginitalea myxolifaciens]
MKHLIAASALLATLTLSAQKGERQQLSPEQRATLKSKEMALHLDLSENQQQQVARLLEAEFAEARKIRESQKASDKSEIDRFERRNAQLNRQLALKAELKNILNDEQYERWQKHQHRKMAQRRNRSPHKRDGHHRRGQHRG